MSKKWTFDLVPSYWFLLVLLVVLWYIFESKVFGRSRVKEALGTFRNSGRYHGTRGELPRAPRSSSVLLPDFNLSRVDISGLGRKVPPEKSSPGRTAWLSPRFQGMELGTE